MNTLWLGRQVNTLWLGLPYAGEVPETPVISDGFAGDGSPNVIVFYTKEEPVKVNKDIVEKLSAKVIKYKKEEYKVSKQAKEQIIGTMVDAWDAKPSMSAYDIDYQEAINRYKELLNELINIILNDEEEALLMILVNL
jgi:protein tyrosine/serine phosphatase